MTEYYDSLKTRNPAERERALMAALSRQIEHAQTHAAGVLETVVYTLCDVTKLRGEVTLVAPGSLVNDGKVIDDVRTYK